MHRFKPGDKVIVRRCDGGKACDHGNSKIRDMQDKVCEVKSFLDDRSRYQIWQEDKKDSWYFDDLDLDPVSETLLTKSKTTTMSILEKAKLIMKKEPNKTFIKAGIMDMNDSLTSEGKELFINFLLEKNQDAFKKEVVDPILAEQEKDSK